MINFRRIVPFMGPGWLTSGDGEKVLYSLGVMLDATLERMRQALHARLPGYTETEDSLGYIGRDRLLLRGRNEPAERYARRLVEWRYPLGHRVRGNAFGLLSQIRAYFLDETKQFTINYRGGAHVIDADGTESRLSSGGPWTRPEEIGGGGWAQFWVGIYGNAVDWEEPELLIGDPNLWGGEISDDSEYAIGLSSAATQSDIQALRMIVRDWKMAGSRPVLLLVITNPAKTIEDVFNDTDTDVIKVPLL